MSHINGNKKRSEDHNVLSQGSLSKTHNSFHIGLDINIYQNIQKKLKNVIFASKYSIPLKICSLNNIMSNAFKGYTYIQYSIVTVSFITLIG